MLLSAARKFTAEELQERATGRFFDRITVVTERPDEIVKNLTDTYELGGWQTGERVDGADRESYARCYLENVELRVVKPLQGDTPWADFLRRSGEGICCVRENVPAEKLQSEIERYESLGLQIVYREREDADETIWIDTFDLWHGYIALHTGPIPTAEEIPGSNPRHLSQLNIVTDDVDRTVAELTAVLEVGPWSIGTLDSKTVSDPGLLVDGEMVAPPFHFQLGITFYSNIEFEVIQPVKGPTVYQHYMDHHGIGYHHIKEVVPPENWMKTMADYADKNMDLVIKGSVGPTSFAYLNSEKAFGFVVELGDGIPADPLPDGYNEYSYP